jgi:hypothetical protein
VAASQGHISLLLPSLKKGFSRLKKNLRGSSEVFHICKNLQSFYQFFRPEKTLKHSRLKVAM